MMTLTLLGASVGGFFMGLTTVVFCLVCVLLILLVLLQPAHGEGLAGAFGGGVTDTFFGTKALSYAWKLTIGLAVTYIVLAIAMCKFPTGKVAGRTVTTPGQSQPADQPGGGGGGGGEHPPGDEDH